MCTPSCQSNYGKDFAYLRELTTISRSNRIMQDLQNKQNLRCVREFLNEIQPKITG